MIDLHGYLNLICDINYALTKVDVPYNPNNFPFKYAVGKDLDIFVHEKDFEKIRDITYIYFKQYSCFEIKVIQSNINYRLRMEYNNKLHYQIDITINTELVLNRIKKANYYILSLENERIVRLYEYNKNNNKKHHKLWLDNNP